MGQYTIASLLTATVLALALEACESPEESGSDAVQPLNESGGSISTQNTEPPPNGRPPPPGGPPPPMPSVFETEYLSAVRIDNGEISELSQLDLLTKGDVQPEQIEGLILSSDIPQLNGVLIMGERSDVVLDDANINLSGMGQSDFLGIGAGAMVAEGKLKITGSIIETAGAVSSATIATEKSFLEVRDSTLIARGGPLPDDYVPKIGPGMMSAPPPLLITGTARTHITMANAKSYFYNSIIEADGWGALSTDAAGGDAYLEANDCIIRVRNSGYGAYADFGAEVVIKNSQMDVPTYGVVIAGEAASTFDNVTGSSGVNLAMIHSVMGQPSEVAQFNVRGGSFVSDDAALLVKSANADIRIDDASIESKTGVLVELRKNEDKHATIVGDYDVQGVTVVLANGNYTGDIIDSDPERDLTVILENANLTGNLIGASLQMDAASSHTEMN